MAVAHAEDLERSSLHEVQAERLRALLRAILPQNSFYARKFAGLPLEDVYVPEEAADPDRMAQALIALPNRAPPSRAVPGLALDGLDKITDQISELLDRRSHARFTLIEGTN